MNRGQASLACKVIGGTSIQLVGRLGHSTPALQGPKFTVEFESLPFWTRTLNKR